MSSIEEQLVDVLEGIREVLRPPRIRTWRSATAENVYWVGQISPQVGSLLPPLDLRGYVDEGGFLRLEVMDRSDNARCGEIKMQLVPRTERR